MAAGGAPQVTAQMASLTVAGSPAALSTPSVRRGDFVPTQRHFLLIGNKSYAQRRLDAGFNGFQDIDESEQDLVNVEASLKSVCAAT